MMPSLTPHILLTYKGFTFYDKKHVYNYTETILHKC